MERQACFILTDFHQQLARLFFLLFPDGVRDIHTLQVRYLHTLLYLLCSMHEGSTTSIYLTVERSAK